MLSVFAISTITAHLSHAVFGDRHRLATREERGEPDDADETEGDAAAVGVPGAGFIDRLSSMQYAWETVCIRDSLYSLAATPN